AEEPVNVDVASVHVRAARGDEGLDPRGGVAEGGAGAVDETPVFLLREAPEEGRPFERPDLHADAGRVEVVADGLGDAGERRVAGVVTRVEAVRVPGFGEQLPGPGWLSTPAASRAGPCASTDGTPP